MMNIKEYFSRCGAIVEKWLDERIESYSVFSSRLTESMRYSLFAGGKRLRPALMFASFGIFSQREETVIPYAASIEALHTYSLIHDDLPAMDDDDLRRGRPTNHKVFGEAEAILAGDALLTKAFEFASDRSNTPGVTDSIRVNAVYALSLAAGDKGMVAGQFADIEAESKSACAEMVDFIHLNKTAALIRYSVSMGAILAGRDNEDFIRLDSFGKNLGIAFQIIDDILDITSDTDTLGKDAGSDVENGKATYPAIHGLEYSKSKADALINEALDIIKPYGEKGAKLAQIAHFITERKS
ncbi:MAG: polyprenyl synthetase family protein [Deferribacterales bacterium]|nr:polyprenyl synthetase family protein [Deferribacterales bacterium]